MRFSDLFYYLIGNREAIERIAGSRFAWFSGAILVFTAGVARNYDHLNLWADAEWFVGPFAASLASTVFIWPWVAAGLRLRVQGSLARQFVVFLSLFWLTSPCAWLYGIPVESWTDLVTATKWNVAFLVAVSLWRVAIIVRSVSVLSGTHWGRCLVLVLTPAAFEMMVGSMFKGQSLVGIMGGIRLPPHDQFLRDATVVTLHVSFWVFLSAAVSIFLIKRSQRAQSALTRPLIPMGRPVLVLPIALLAGALLATQPMQTKVRNMQRLQTLLHQDGYPGAIRFASDLSRSDFPAAHPIPPDTRYRSFDFELLAAHTPNAPKWLREEWEQKLQDAPPREEWYIPASRSSPLPSAPQAN